VERSIFTKLGEAQHAFEGARLYKACRCVASAPSDARAKGREKVVGVVMYGRPYVRQRRTRDIRRARERAEHAQEATAAGSNG
jgi:hypothetical protein